MAVIKSGQSSDQWTIDAQSKAGRVTLYNADGTVASLVNLTIPSTVAATLAQESGGNLARQSDDNLNQIIPLLTEIRMELRIMNALMTEIAVGNIVSPPDLDREYRRDPYFSDLSGRFTTT